MKRSIDKLLQSLRKIPPNVKGTPIDRNQFIEEMASEPIFEKSEIGDDYKKICVELWRIIEDIEKAEVVTPNDIEGFRSIIKQLADKRFIYMNYDEIKEIIADKKG